MDLFNDIELWRLSEELNVPQATLLILNLDPSLYSNIESETQKPVGYEAVSTAIKNAINSDRLKSEKRYYQTFNDTVIDWVTTTFNVEDFKHWLESRKFIDNFFFHEGTSTAPYLDPANPQYAPKMAAAINAWVAITNDPTLLEGKTPKQAIEKFLREHASQYGLTLENGNPNQTAIEEICKVANWSPLGGVAKTPTRVKGNPPTPSKSNTKALDEKAIFSKPLETEFTDPF